MNVSYWEGRGAANVAGTTLRLPTMAAPYGSPSRLDLCLLCTRSHGTPVEDILTHSPRFPFVIDYCQTFLTANDQMGIVFAFWHCDRIRRFCPRTPGAIMKELIVVIDYKFPILEYLHIPLHSDTVWHFPLCFKHPKLRHLGVAGLTSPVGSSLLIAHMSLVTLPPNVENGSSEVDTEFGGERFR